MRIRHHLVGLAVLALSPTVAAAAWAPQVTISPAGSARYASPHAAVSISGRALVAWIRTSRSGGRSTARVEVVSRARPRARWSRPRQRSAGGATIPRVALNARGDAATAWVRGRSVVASVRRGPLGRWSVSRVIRAGGAVQDLHVAVDRHRRTTVVWSERRGQGFVVRLSVHTSPRAGWRLRPARVSVPGPAPPAIALSAGSGALVAWTADQRTWASRTVDGAFEPPVELSSEDSGSPVAALSPSGVGLAAWAADLPGGSSVVLGAGRTTPAREWGASRDLGIGEVPRAAINDRGDAVVAWSLAGPGAPQGIEATTRSGRGPWRATTVVPRSNCRCVLSVGSAAIDGSGNALVGWRRADGSGAGSGGAAASRVGASDWTRAVLTPGRVREAPTVAAGRDAGGIAVWAEEGSPAGIRVATFRPG